MANVWQELHKQYEDKDWLDKPSIFAEQVVSFLPSGGSLLDLGAGQGQDSIYFAQGGYSVTCTDIEQSALDKAKLKADGLPIEFLQVDATKSLPFENESFDVVYAHLSLHYFDDATTRAAFKDIYRVLKPGGIFAFFVNSTSDPEYGTGERLEEDFYFVEDKAKRYMSVESARDFAKDFEVILADNNGETYKDIDKGVHNLIRFIGRKRA